MVCIKVEYLYIILLSLQTPPNEMQSMLGMKLKRQMLLALAREDSLYPNDPEKKAKILKRYGKYIVPVSI